MITRFVLRCCGQYFVGLALAASCAVTFAFAQETESESETETETETESERELNQIIVTGTRLETTQRTDGSASTVLTEQQLEDGQYRTTSDALQQVPGVDVVQSGGPGANTSIFIRGADSGQTLVLLDGIELNNPASTNRSFNMANLTLENIERVEIIRGPQSTIYGSDAMGGVINLVSKKAQKGVHVNATSEAGSYSSFNQIGSITYGSETLDVSTAITQQNLGSVSAASPAYGNGEPDRYDNTSLSGRLRFAPSELFDATSTIRYVDSQDDLDNFGGSGGDDPNRTTNNHEFFTRGDFTGHFLSKTLEPTAYVSYTHQSLEDTNFPDEISFDTLDSAYNGDVLTYGGRLAWSPKKFFSITAGGESQRERASSYYYSDGPYGPFNDVLPEESAQDDAAYAESRVSYDESLYIDAGVRHDQHSIFGNHTTFKVAPAWLVTSSTKLHGSVGTGFKAPSLVQLYSSYGNPDLEAEDSTGWDIGIDQDILKDRASLSVTYYRNTFDNLITFNPETFILENIDSAQSQGLEVAGNLKWMDEISTRVSYTYDDTENDLTGESLLRRPRNKAAITTVLTPTSRIRSQIQWRLYSSRADYDYNAYPPQRVALAGYGIVDVALSYQISSEFELIGRVNNLFDKSYEEVFGFGTMGINAFGGIKVTL